MTDTAQQGPTAETPPPGGARSLRGLMGRVAGASALALLVSEFVSFVQTIALARLLSPAEIGIFVAGTVLTIFLGNFVEGGLRSGLIQRETSLADAAETVFWVTLAGGVLMSLAALAAAPLIGLVFDNSTAGLIAAATSGVLLVYSVTNVPEALLQRAFSVRRRLIVGPLVSVTYAVVAVSLAAAGWGVWAMVGGTYASYLVWAIAVWKLTAWRPGRGRASVRLWRELAGYGLPLVLGMIGSKTRAAVEAVVVGHGLSASALGHFRYGQRIARIPMMGIIEIGSVALFPAFSRIVDDPDRMRAAYVRALHLAMVAAAAAGGLMLALGEPAVVILLGEPWRGAGVAVVAMAGISMGSAMTCVAEEAIKASGRTGLLNWYTLTEVVIGLGLLLVLVRPFGLVGAALSLSITSIIVGLAVLVLAGRVIAVRARRLVVALATPLPGSMAATAAVGWLAHTVLRPDGRPLLVALGLLALNTVAFLVLYLAGLSVFAPSTVVSLVRAGRRMPELLRGSRAAGGTATHTPASKSGGTVESGTDRQ